MTIKTTYMKVGSLIINYENAKAVFFIFASTSTIPGHICQFNDLPIKIWKNNNTETTIRVFLSLIVNYVSIRL